MRDTGPVARGTATNSGPLSPIYEAQSAIVEDQDIVREDVLEKSEEAREIPHTTSEAADCERKRGAQPNAHSFSQLVQVLRVREGAQPSSQSSESRSKCHQQRDCSGLLFSQGCQWRTKPASVGGP